MTNNIKELRRMAAVAAMTPEGQRNSKGKMLPIRYRVAAQIVASMKGGR